MQKAIELPFRCLGELSLSFHQSEGRYPWLKFLLIQVMKPSCEISRELIINWVPTFSNSLSSFSIHFVFSESSPLISQFKITRSPALKILVELRIERFIIELTFKENFLSAFPPLFAAWQMTLASFSNFGIDKICPVWTVVIFDGSIDQIISMDESEIAWHVKLTVSPNIKGISKLESWNFGGSLIGWKMCFLQFVYRKHADSMLLLK